MTEKQKAGMKVYYYVASFVLLMFVLFYASNLVSQLSGILSTTSTEPYPHKLRGCQNTTPMGKIRT